MALCLLVTLLSACAASPATAPSPAATAVAAVPATPVPAAAPSATPRRGPPPDEGQGSYGDAGVDLYAQPAAEFPEGLEWLNTSRPLSLAELRGKVVLLDFWTYGCVNCLHNFPDLKRLEAEHPNELVVIGVHSAKFTGEGESENLRQVLLRYELDHPVINDNKKLVWSLYNAQAWPTLVLIDTRGTLAGLHVGEGVYRVFKSLILKLVREAENTGRLNREPLPLAAERAGQPDTVLSFPGRVLPDPQRNRLFIADTNHHRIVIADPASGEVQQVIGGGQRALTDGDYRTAAFASPQGMALSPDGNTLYVADTGNHALRTVDLLAGNVATLAGTGQQAREYPPVAGVAPDVTLSSPWDLATDGNRLFVAMAGSHQIWALTLSSGAFTPLAGSGTEGTNDGPRAEAELAQPSGLALDGKGRLYFADTESSSIRWVEISPVGGVVGTLAGGSSTSLFAFGDSDGIGREARLQHPLSLAYADGALLVADSYNHKIKRVDAATGEVRTLLGSERGWSDGAQPRFYEPGGVAYANNTLYVADTNNHVVRIVDIKNNVARTLVLRGIERFNPSADDDGFRGEVIELPPATLAPGTGTLRLNVTLPAGYKVNDLAPSALEWRVAGDGLLVRGEASRSLAGMQFPFDLPLEFGSGTGTLSADLTIIYCAAETPDICLINEARLVAPIAIAAGGANVLELRHSIALPGE